MHLKDSIEPRIEAMDAFRKVRATKALVDNALLFKELPDKVKEEVDDLKSDLEQVHKYVKVLLEEQEQLKEKAKIVVDKKLK